jgi:hypothetical protein
MQFGQHRRIATIGLHPVTRFLRDQRRSDHSAVMAKPAQQPMKAIATRAGFIAEAQSLSATPEPSRKLDRNVSAVLDHAIMSHLTTSTFLGDWDRDR